MLDYFCIFSKGGALLWTWQLTALRGSPVEALIRTCLLEERSGEKSFTYKPPVGAAYTLKWTLDNVSANPLWLGFGKVGYSLEHVWCFVFQLFTRDLLCQDVLPWKGYLQLTPE